MTPEPYLQITWVDPDTGTRGYLVIDSLVHGSASGGLRMRAGCTLAEVADLARGMTLKEALVYDPADRYVPFGGAKGGIDCSPYDPDARGVLTRFLRAVLPIVRSYWSTGEDFGVRQADLDSVAAELGLPSTIEPAFARLADPAQARQRLSDAFAVEVDGVNLGDLVGGYGVAEAAVAAAERLGRDPKETTAFVQGFGSIGGAAARYLAAAGVRVVGVCDRDGVIANPAGLDVETLLRHRDAYGCVDRAALGPDDERRPATDWLTVPADILVPAAMSYVLTEENLAGATGRLVVVEGANNPTLPAAEAALTAAGVPVVPDFLANHATNAWWWWVVFGDIAPTAEASFAKIGATMRRLVGAAFDAAAASGRPLRAAALELARDNADRLRALPD
jgi:glutamate dehydrogenase (NAD(P)+)